METLLRDARYALRAFSRSPGFTVVAMLTLALGIGATTALFSIINGVLLRPLPYPEPGRLVTVLHYYPSQNDLEAPVAVPTYRDLGAESGPFERVSVASWWGVNLTGGEQPERVRGSRVSGEFFATYGVPAALGRAVQPADVAEGRDHLVVLSDGLWRRSFGGDPGVVGRTIQLDGEGYEVIGVMPPGFRDVLHPDAEIWSPAVFPPETSSNRGIEFLSMTARLRAGVTVEQAGRWMTAFAERVKEANPGTYPDDWTFRLRTLDERTTGQVRPALLILLGAVGFVLLIACANIANLMLARAIARRKEIAVRGAMGAGRGQLVRQLLTESVLLSLSGGLLGIGLARLAVHALVAWNPTNLPRVDAIRVDGVVLLFAVGVAFATGILFGLVPAAQVARVDLQSTLREGGRSGDGGGLSARRVLVVAEVALALTLLVGAGLLVRSFARLQEVDPGFEPRGVVTMILNLPPNRYTSDTAQVAYFQEVLHRLQSTPGIGEAGAVSSIPFSGDWNTGSFTVEGFTPAPDQQGPWGDVRVADPNYFRTMRVPLLRGRYFTAADRMGSRPVAIVDERLAKQYWPNQDPIGRRIAFGGGGDDGPDWIEVVGVVGHVAQDALDAEPRVQVYLPLFQVGAGAMGIMVRAPTGDPMRVMGAVRAAIRSVDSDQPIAEVHTAEALMTRVVGQRRLSMLLLGAFAGIALLLASVGIYGIMAFDVTRRAREIGVRMALGAERGSIHLLMMRRGMGLVLTGVAIGVVAALGLTRLLGSQLYEVGATDPTTFVVVPVLLIAVAMLASFLPARRAARVDPVVALRSE